MTEFRKAGPPDVPELSRLARSAYAVYQPRMRRPPAPVIADYAAAVRAGQVWVAEESGRVVGLLVLAGASGGLLLENVAVHPDAQGRGAGSSMPARPSLPRGTAGWRRPGCSATWMACAGSSATATTRAEAASDRGARSEPGRFMIDGRLLVF